MVHASEAQMAHDWDDYISEPDEAEEAEEEWRPVVGFEGLYEVSETGSVKRLVGARGTRAGHILKPVNDGKGYLNLRLSRPGAQKRIKLHRIVAAAFHGAPTDAAPLVRHLDGNPHNNDYRNLRWGTAQENSDDRILHGRATGWHSRQTHCKRGHPFDEANTRKKARPHGKTERVCRTCHREQRQIREARI